MQENQGLFEEFGRFGEYDHDQSKEREYAHPESTEEAVEKLQEYVNLSKSGTEVMEGETATLLKMEPIPEQMPDEYAAVGGLINLWIGKDSKLPLAIFYSGGSMGEASVTLTDLDVNSRLDDSIFTFEIPDGAEMITFADLHPQSLTLEEAADNAKFELLTPTETPEGAILVDIVEMRGAMVQRYTLPEGGSFTVAQGPVGNTPEGFGGSDAKSETVEVRGTTGQIFKSESGDKVLLTWTEGDLFFSVAGDLTADYALVIAESLE
jgi:hypothetical protein